MYINREMEKILKTAVKQFPAIIVTGPRQSGKTTLLKHLFLKSHEYVSMDNPEHRIMAKDEPRIFLENHPNPVIIDEIQYVPELLSYIKIIIDSKRQKKGQFLLTGSQLFPLMKNVSESLAGRIAVLTLLQLSFKELQLDNKRFEINSIKRQVISGGFPEINTTRKPDINLWFGSYLHTYLERDVRQLSQIGDLTDFQRFMQLLATLNGQIINMSNISRDLGVAVNTVKSWLSILEASGQIIILKPFYINKGKRMIKSPKIYFIDTGFLCFLTGITTTNQVFKSPGSGQLFETVVLIEILKYFYNSGKRAGVYFWRTSNGEEVDLIIEEKGRIIPIEIKLTSSINERMLKSLSCFCELFHDKVDKGFLVNLSGNNYKYRKKMFSISVNSLVGEIFGKVSSEKKTIP